MMKFSKSRTLSFTANESHLPSRYLFVLILIPWPIWVYSFGPQPTPLWMMLTAVVSVVAMIGLPTYALIQDSIKIRKSRLEDSYLASFEPVDKLELAIVDQELKGEIGKYLSIRKCKSRDGWSGHCRGTPCCFYQVLKDDGESSSYHFCVRVRTIPAPATVAFRKTNRIGKVINSIGAIAMPEDSFKRHWVVQGDEEVARTLLDQSICAALNSMSYSGPRAWVWYEDSLWLSIPGKPTGRGVNESIEHATDVAQLAGIAAGENRPAEPGG